MTVADTHRSIEAVWKIESPRLIAGLTRVTRDIGLAEDLAQDALLAALEQWPSSGIPRNPAAWLMAIAKNRAIDHFRRRSLLDRKHQELGAEFEIKEMTPPDFDSALDDHVGDDLLKLIFISCHPVLSKEAQLALTLRLLGGLTTDEIARAFLVPEPTIAQRIVRAKRTLAEKQAPFEIPRGTALADRLAAVLEVIYLIFNEGYSATAGDDWMRPTLCEEALRLGRILAELAPENAEVHGLIALMEIQASRSRARVSSTGEPILLFDQNRAHWDRLLIQRGLNALARAERTRAQQAGPKQIDASQQNSSPGSYELQAAIAACHARALTSQQTDWPQIVDHYTSLYLLTRSPIVALNRAVAVGMADGPQAGLGLVDTLLGDPSLASYHLLPAVRGDLLNKLGRQAEARQDFERAAALTRNARERELLLDRARACATQ